MKRVSKSHGEEGIELLNGQRIRFRTRTKGGGRGFAGDFLALDEAMILPEASHGALLPTLSARPNPQVWYMGSPVDQLIHEHGIVWARVRERGIAGEDDALAYFEWSIDPRQPGDEGPVDPSQVTEAMAMDHEAWRQANPAMGIRISPEHIEHERRSMDPRTFAVERLGVGDWPDTSPEASSLIDLARWRGLTDANSKIVGPVSFAFDVREDRRSSSISAAGRRADGKLHVEVVDRRGGTGWLPERLAELRAHKPAAVLCDGSSPAASLVDDVRGAGVKVTTVDGGEYAKACGVFFDLVEDQLVRHIGTPELDAAIAGAATRPLLDAWALSRTRSRADVAPLVSATIAAWHAEKAPRRRWAPL